MLGRLEAVRGKQDVCELQNKGEQNGAPGVTTYSPVVGVDALGEGQLRGGPLNHSNQGDF